MTPERWREIETLYHAARECPPDERAAFLSAACPADEALRREVEHLLGQPASDEGFLAGPVPTIATTWTSAPAAMTGRTLGGYHVQALIGVGGMGEVYRAQDAKLGRTVAIKVLPHAFTSDAARLARFDREARTLAALNHPNICAIYGFEEVESVRFLVLEFVDGETLADRLAASRARPHGPGLLQRDALHVARQIARALDFAHERGIVHRDLKPANIKIAADGTVKVLDFGLAKAAAGDAAGADLEPVLRMTDRATIEGTLIGTPAYMSPEQARGQVVDKRADIWAFGCVLYEMLTGRVTFLGDTIADTIAKILEREPDWTALPATTPEPIRNLLLGCLAKEPRERLRDVGDVRITIDGILSGSSAATTAPPDVRTARPRAGWLPWAVVAVLVVALAGMAAWNLRPQPSPRVHSTIEIPPGQALDGSYGSHILALSRDGTQMAYVASRLLYLRPLGQDEATLIPGIELYPGAREPVFSPNGQEIAFYTFTERELRRMPVTGGQAQRICEADSPTGIDWSPNGIVLFGQGRNGIWRVQASGGVSERVASVRQDEEAHGPHLLPDGDHFLFTIATGHARDRWDKAGIFVQSLSNPNDRRRLDITGSDARYVRATRHLVYALSGNVYVIGFDLDRLTVKGDPVLVQEGVSRATGSFTGTANFSVSENGTFVYVPGPASGDPVRMEVALIDPAAKRVDPLKIPAAAYDSVRVSPDESRIAFGKGEDQEWTVYTSPIGAPSIQRLTDAGSNNRFPVWTRDGDRIAFQSDREGANGIWWQSARGPGGAERLTKPEGESHIPESWFGDTLLYSVTKKGRSTLWTLIVRNGKPVDARQFGRSVSTDVMSGVFSPDGHMVAYTLTEGARTMPTICVEPFPAGERKCLTPKPVDSPKHPRWSPDGKRLFYDPRFGSFESVSVQTDPALGFGEPRNEEFHPFQMAPPGARTPYDITKSGKFLGLTTPGKNGYEPRPLNKIQVVTNWFEVLRGKAPR